MLQRLRDALRPSKGGSLARAFTRLGWAGFWLQIVFGSLPIIVTIYYFTFSSAASEGGLAFVEYLAIADLLMLFFTTFWSYRYTRLGKQMLDPARRPTESSVIEIVWTGLLAIVVGMVFSMIVLLIEAAHMLFYFLKAPQGGIPVVQTSGAGGANFVSSVDMVSLMALILTLFSELLVLVFSLWLLFRTTQGSPEFPQAAAGQPSAAPAPAGTSGV